MERTGETKLKAAAEHATADPSHVRGTKVSLIFFFSPPRQGGPSCDQRERPGKHGEEGMKDETVGDGKHEG